MFEDQSLVWENFFYLKLEKIKEQKIVNFNFKVMHNYLATPDKLLKWKILGSDLCYMCFSKGNMEHMMISCPYFCTFYNVLGDIFTVLGYKNLVFNFKTLICGYKCQFDENTDVNILLCVIFL